MRITNLAKRGMKTVEQRLKSQFGIGQGREWILTEDETTEMLSFIRSEITQAKLEVVEEIEKSLGELTPIDFSFGNYISVDGVKDKLADLKSTLAEKK